MRPHRTIVAIGGGEIGRPGKPVETLAIDKEIVRLTGKKRPALLFIPTASDDSEGYAQVVKRHFGGRLNCKVKTLNLVRERPARREIERTVLAADVVYVGGGNTLKMIRVWKKYGVDKILLKAWRSGVVLSGLSAGSLCWFAAGNSDSQRFSGKTDWKAVRVAGLGLINAFHSPHYNTEAFRKPSFRNMLRKEPRVGIALDNCAALVTIDDTYRIIASKHGAKAYKAYWKNGKFHIMTIKATREPQPLAGLLAKN